MDKESEEYEFLSVERTTAKSSDYETRALLHLMNFSDEKGRIEQFAIDCFNDVTGMDNSCLSLQDVQAKGEGNIPPKKLGSYLVTLFENYLSSFAKYFETYTLFIQGVSKTVLEDAASEFSFCDIQAESQEKVRNGLAEECRKRENGIDNSRITDDNLDDFLSRVRFVIAKPERSDYIIPLIHTRTGLFPEKGKLETIFFEIKVKQNALKLRDSIVHKRINRPDKVIDWGRALKRRNIELLIIERLLDRSFLSADTPRLFQKYLEALPLDIPRKAIIEDAKNAICLQYFDKNNSDAFWALLDTIVDFTDANPDAGIEEIYDAIEIPKLKACTHLDRQATLYFIATVKSGVKND